MSVMVTVYGGAAPWIVGPDPAEPIQLDNILLDRPSAQEGK